MTVSNGRPPESSLTAPRRTLRLLLAALMLACSASVVLAVGATVDAGAGITQDPAPQGPAPQDPDPQTSSPMVTVAARSDPTGPTVPLLVVGTVGMLGIGFGMLGLRCVRGTATDC